MGKIDYDQEYISNKVFEFIYDCALRDATLQQTFKGKKEWIKEIDEARMCLREYMDKLLSGNFKSKIEHDTYFLDTANSICDIIRRKVFYYWYDAGEETPDEDFSTRSSRPIYKIDKRYYNELDSLFEMQSLELQ